MGIYYLVANHTKREWLCGWCLGERWKFMEMATSPCISGPLFSLLMGHWRRDSIELIGDVDDRYEVVREEYMNVSPQAAARWNEEICPGMPKAWRASIELCASCRGDADVAE